MADKTVGTELDFHTSLSPKALFPSSVYMSGRSSATNVEVEGHVFFSMVAVVGWSNRRVDGGAGVGNLISDDGGPLWGQILFAAVLIAGAALVVVGIRWRPGRPQLGSRLIGIGTLPGATGIALFWSPPAVAFGVLALATSITAFRNADGVPTSGRTSLLVTLAAALGAAVLAVGVS